MLRYSGKEPVLDAKIAQCSTFSITKENQENSGLISWRTISLDTGDTMAQWLKKMNFSAGKLTA